MQPIKRYWNKVYAKASNRAVRWFGVVLAFVLVLTLYVVREPRNEWLLLPAILPLISILFLPALRFVYAASMLLTRPIGWTVSWLVLLLVYLFILTPVSFFRSRRFPAGWQPSETTTRPEKMHE